MTNTTDLIISLNNAKVHLLDAETELANLPDDIDVGLAKGDITQAIYELDRMMDQIIEKEKVK